MSLVKLSLEYDGTGFAGWAAQPGLRTVEGELRKALEGMKPGEIVSLRVYNTQAKNRRIERIRLGE